MADVHKPDTYPGMNEWMSWIKAALTACGLKADFSITSDIAMRLRLDRGLPRPLIPTKTLGDAADAGGAKLGKVNEVVVTAWLDGSKELPTAGDRGFRYLVLALEPWLDHGSGAKVTVEFDPWNELSGASSRPAHVGLFHELIHAWYYVSGRQIFTDDHTENELMVIGLPGFDVRATGHQRLYTENRYRNELGMGPRLSI